MKMMPIGRRACLLTIRTSRQKISVSRHGFICKYKLNYYSTTDPQLSNQNKNSVIMPQPLTPASESANIGVEMVGEIDVKEVKLILDKFFEREELRTLARENGLDDKMLEVTKASFKKFSLQVTSLPSELHITFSDILNNNRHVLDIFPLFLKHIHAIYPHLKYAEELSIIGDLTNPAISYSLARSMNRKLIFHYGPTNSGKTYKAMKMFLKAQSGVYCAPLKLLANEIYERSNAAGVPCDLVTGEDKKKAFSDGRNASHVSCTIEMLSTDQSYDVAVIDEIQMLKDNNRGYAWTRALLGVAAKEVHLCGEESALNFIKTVAEKLDEDLEVHKYNRLTKLFLEDKAVEKFENIRSGDCIICFSKKDIFFVSTELEKLGINCAVVYGTLPPFTKTTQSNIFNDPETDCNVLVATDAIGLGMNLNIRRIVFFSVLKAKVDDSTSAVDLKKVPISVSQALQISGRAGRYNSRYSEGYVTTFKKEELPILKKLLQSTPDPVVKAGLCPTVEHIETFSYYLPYVGMSELIGIFNSVCKLDNSLYFICDMKTFRILAKQIKHIPLQLKIAFQFCCAPVNTYSIMVQALFVQFAKKFSRSEVITDSFLKSFLSWPLKEPRHHGELVQLEEAFDCLDMYLWFGYRFPYYFPHMEAIKIMQKELDILVMKGISNMLASIKYGSTNIYRDRGQEFVNAKLKEYILIKGMSPSSETENPEKQDITTTSKK